MRTTIDLPDDLYRTLKARAALSGMRMRELITRFIRDGLQRPEDHASKSLGRRDAPPVIIPPAGESIPPRSRAELARLDDEEDEVRCGRSSGR